MASYGCNASADRLIIYPGIKPFCSMRAGTHGTRYVVLTEAFTFLSEGRRRKASGPSYRCSHDAEGVQPDAYGVHANSTTRKRFI